MIITLAKADFSLSNIGTLTTWSIKTTLGAGATSSSDVTSVSRTENTGYSTTITLDDGYTLGTVSVTMGGTDITSTAFDSSTNKITISEVTGNVVIKVPTVDESGNESTGEEDSDILIAGVAKAGQTTEDGLTVNKVFLEDMQNDIVANEALISKSIPYVESNSSLTDFNSAQNGWSWCIWTDNSIANAPYSSGNGLLITSEITFSGNKYTVQEYISTANNQLETAKRQRTIEDWTEWQTI